MSGNCQGILNQLKCGNSDDAIVTAHIRRMGKVLFSQVSVCSHPGRVPQSQVLSQVRSTCYAAGSMPLAFRQEDCLVQKFWNFCLLYLPAYHLGSSRFGLESILDSGFMENVEFLHPVILLPKKILLSELL